MHEWLLLPPPSSGCRSHLASNSHSAGDIPAQHLGLLPSPRRTLLRRLSFVQRNLASSGAIRSRRQAQPSISCGPLGGSVAGVGNPRILTG